MTGKDKNDKFVNHFWFVFIPAKSTHGCVDVYRKILQLLFPSALLPFQQVTVESFKKVRLKERLWFRRN